ncbi:MAG: hypothetical protein ACLSB9_35980 [Hydrogeniiclostridium mannosilyticum]
MAEVHTIVDDAMSKGNRSVSIYISPDGGMSISVSPRPDEESVRAVYEQGKSPTMITVRALDFPVKT